MAGVDRIIRGQEKIPMKLRLIYSKTGLIRFISHRDLMRVFFRAFQRANFPVSFSQGFSPHPRVEFCPPLPVGMEGLNEILDVRLSRPVETGKEVDELQVVLPTGIEEKTARLLADETPTLGKSIERAEYQVFLLPDMTISRKEITDFLSRPEVWLEKEREGRIKKVEVRSGVLDLRFTGELLLTVTLKANTPTQDILVALTGKRPEELSGLRWRRLRFLGRDL